MAFGRIWQHVRTHTHTSHLTRAPPRRISCNIRTPVLFRYFSYDPSTLRPPRGRISKPPRKRRALFIQRSPALQDRVGRGDWM